MVELDLGVEGIGSLFVLLLVGTLFGVLFVELVGGSSLSLSTRLDLSAPFALGVTEFELLFAGDVLLLAGVVGVELLGLV